MNYRVLVIGLILGVTGTFAQGTWTPPRTPDGQPDLQGIWNSASGTPMERPNDLKGKEFFTPQEALDWEKRMVAKSKQDVRVTADPNSVGTYNDVFWEIGTKPVKTLRTSVVIDPPDGKVPALTPEAMAERKRRFEKVRHPGGPEDLSLQDQCLMFPTDAPPMTPYNYNSNYRIVQTKDQVAIYVEMIHDTRIIPLDGRPHLPQTVRLWFGDSVGHWEGDTLVVDTTNFTDKTSFYGSDRNLHVVERFRRLDDETLVYQFDVDDPTAFTRPWKGELTMSASSGPIYEYACHEGNYGLVGVLRGERAAEKAAAAGK
ncbi:MAG TPA: hypothetical protein VKR43_22015 [Bryobacteraceae bacterium]|nr:hypothetical protein [Bryobacteraceae bacterium]